MTLENPMFKQKMFAKTHTHAHTHEHTTSYSPTQPHGASNDLCIASAYYFTIIAKSYTMFHQFGMLKWTKKMFKNDNSSNKIIRVNPFF